MRLCSLGFASTFDNANARRIVACVNACEGIPTELIEKHGVTRSGIAKWVDEITQQRDELHAIVCACLTALGNGSGATKQCSVEFLSNAPTEILLYVGDMRQQRDDLLAAARNLRDVKGRHHSEQAFKALIDAIAKHDTPTQGEAP